MYRLGGKRNDVRHRRRFAGSAFPDRRYERSRRLRHTCGNDHRDRNRDRFADSDRYAGNDQHACGIADGITGVRSGGVRERSRDHDPGCGQLDRAGQPVSVDRLSVRPLRHGHEGHRQT